MSGYESPTPDDETTGERGAGDTGTTGGETGGATGGGSPGDPDAMGADDSLTVEEGGGRPQAVETSTVDDRTPDGDDETVAVEHVDDIRPPSARENLRLT